MASTSTTSVPVSPIVSLTLCEDWISSNLSALNDTWATQYDDLLSSCNSASADSTDEWTQSIHVAAIFIILCCSILGAGLPLLTKYVQALAIDPYYFFCGKAIGIGIILSCGLVHMLQPASASLTDPSLPSAFNQDYNAYAFMYAMLAILAMNFMDYCVLKLSRKWILEKIQEVRVERASKNKGPAENSAQHADKMIELASPSNVGKGTSSGDHQQAQVNNNRSSVVVFHAQQQSTGEIANPAPDVTNTEQPEKSSEANSTSFEEGKCDNCDNAVKNIRSIDDEMKNAKGHSHDAVQQLLILAQELPAEYSYLLKFGMLEFGLTVHSVLIGITEGVAADARFKTLLVALVFHQFFEGVALGSRLAASNISKLWHAALLVLIFAVSAPIGISLGIGIVNSTSATGPTYLLTEGTFDAVCGGILIYLGVNLLTHDFARDMEEVCSGKPYETFMRLGLFTSLYTGAGVMSYIGKYL